MFGRVSNQCTLCFFIVSGDTIFQGEGTVVGPAFADPREAFRGSMAEAARRR
jgi:hypothetical protein